jgi:hypothetical protein
MLKRKLVKAVQSLLRIVGRLSKRSATRATRSLMRTLMRRSRRGNLPAGFVLPTVTMVMLVVVLLTLAVTMRTFDRAQNARNFQVDQTTLAASMPAIDRARAKLNYLLGGGDTTLPRGTPSDDNLYTAMRTSPSYTFDDETRLKIAYDIDNNKTINTPTATTLLTEEETITTAWRFPVDTDGNGTADSYTIYGIFFRNPPRDTTTGDYQRARNPLEARTTPMTPTGKLGDVCQAALGSDNTDTGWNVVNGQLKKAFFVYTLTVPIINPTTNQEKGKTTFTALEFQQDRVRVPLNNNAVWFEDDIEVHNVTSFRLNGRLFTNSNLMLGKATTGEIGLYQVSDPNSCFYSAENGKVVIGGNVVNSDVRDGSGTTNVHLYKGKTVDPKGPNDSDVVKIGPSNVTTDLNLGSQVGYDTNKYSTRLGFIVNEAFGNAPSTLQDADKTNDPANVDSVAAFDATVKQTYKDQVIQNPTKDRGDILKGALQTYFQERMRRVPFADTGADNTAPQGTPLYPADAWMDISTTGLTPQFPPATDPKQVKNNIEYSIGDRVIVGNNLPYRWSKGEGTFADPKEPQTLNIKWKLTDGTSDSANDRTRISAIETLPDLGDTSRDGYWESASARKPKAGQSVGGLRIVTGAGIYVDETLYDPTNPNDPTKTTADTAATFKRSTTTPNTFLPAPAFDLWINTTIEPNIPKYNNLSNIVTWPDSMPMWKDTNLDGIPTPPTVPPTSTSDQKGDLQMRATVVYHYTQNSSAQETKIDPAMTPIACVSSYYDPSTSLTARNLQSLLDVSGGIDTDLTDALGTIGQLADGTTPPARNNNTLSNNGVVYPYPGRNMGTYQTALDRQARLVFPNGRIVNPTLRKALANTGTRSLSENAAIDSAICSLSILGVGGTPATVMANPPIPHGAIKEASFLDARQVKSLSVQTDKDLIVEDQDPTKLTNRYTLPLEQRQPLEIRVTEIDLNLLRKTQIGTGTGTGANNNQEYLLPNSGIIYATRDDASPDLSDATDPNNPTVTNQLNSASDFKLDPNRRPHGIRLINGSNLSRTNDFRYAEKGLILATDLPLYVKANDDNEVKGFNLHKAPGASTIMEEFTTTLAADWKNFYTRYSGPTSLNRAFACREGQRGCQGSDQWRAATIVADAITTLSNTFNDGFRDRGDFDLRNNQGNSAVVNSTDSKKGYKPNGFWFNNFVTSADWANTSSPITPKSLNSYLTNGATPIQRRASFPEYLMEVCTKLPVSECGPTDWWLVPPNSSNTTYKTGLKASSVIGTDITTLTVPNAGTTVSLASASLQRYARRVAFMRDGTGNLADNTGTALTTFPLSNPSDLIVLGIDSGKKIQQFPLSTSTVPNLNSNSLWFMTTTDTTKTFKPTSGTGATPTYKNTDRLLVYEPIKQATDQPRLMPILQIQNPTGTPGNAASGMMQPNWMQQVSSKMTFNATWVTKNSPSRVVTPTPLLVESGGGLHNFMRLLESWSNQNLAISGNFIQTGQSKYATAPFTPFDKDQTQGLLYNDNKDYYPNDSTSSGFRYRGGANSNSSPFYMAAGRLWGFDVGLLSQSPDLFAERFTSPPVASPDEFFRGVSRNDDWVAALLCAAEASDRVGGTNANYSKFALPQQQRSSTKDIKGQDCSSKADNSSGYPGN